MITAFTQLNTKQINIIADTVTASHRSIYNKLLTEVLH